MTRHLRKSMCRATGLVHLTVCGPLSFRTPRSRPPTLEPHTPGHPIAALVITQPWGHTSWGRQRGWLRPGETDTDRAPRVKGTLPPEPVSPTAEAVAAVLCPASPDAASMDGSDPVIDGGGSA